MLWISFASGYNRAIRAVLTVVPLDLIVPSHFSPVQA